MKLSISLPDEDLENAYTSAWEEWSVSGEAPLWEVTTQDGDRRKAA